MRTAVQASTAGALALLLLGGCTAGPSADRRSDDHRVDVPSTATATSTATDGQQGTSQVTALDARVDRAAHTASLLPDGRVWVAGGCVVDGCAEATDRTELYDPTTGGFSEGPTLAQRRDGHTATTLPNGDVLLVGGYAGEGQQPLSSAELYVAASGKVVPAGRLAVGRGAHAAVLLKDGRVLVVGGWRGPGTFTGTAELWDPRTGAFTSADPLSGPRGGASASRLTDGRVLVVGGEGSPSAGLATSEIYDPLRDEWEAGPMLHGPRFKHSAVTLASGDVLVVGGTPDDEALVASVERFEGTRFLTAGTLIEGRYKLTDAVVALPDGRVVVAGGGRSVEVYDPVTQRSSASFADGDLRSSFATATVLVDGTVLVFGGYDERIDLRRRAYVLRA